MSEKQLRGAYLRTAPAGHLDETDWERLALGEMSPAERVAALDHIVRCAQCARIQKGLLALEEEASAVNAGVPARAARPRASPRWWWFAATSLAAAALAAVLVPVALREGGDPPARRPEVFRGSPGSPWAPVEPVGALAAVPGQFRWTAPEPASSFVVQLFAEDGKPLWRSAAVSAPSHPWPASVRVEPGRYFWWVEARTTDGRTIRSPLASFTLSGR